MFQYHMYPSFAAFPHATVSKFQRITISLCWQSQQGKWTSWDPTILALGTTLSIIYPSQTHHKRLIEHSIHENTLISMQRAVCIIRLRAIDVIYIPRKN